MSLVPLKILDNRIIIDYSSSIALNPQDILTKLPIDLLGEIIRYLGKEAQKLPQLNKTLWQLFNSDKFWENFIGKYFPEFKNSKLPPKQLAQQLLLSVSLPEIILENICRGEFSTFPSDHLRWDAPEMMGQLPEVTAEERHAEHQHLMLHVYSPRFNSFGSGCLIFTDLSNQNQAPIVIHYPHGAPGGKDYSGQIAQLRIQGELLVTRAVSDENIKIWDLTTYKCVKTFSDQPGNCLTTFHVDAEHIYAGNSNGEVLKWNLEDKEGASPIVLLSGIGSINSIVKLDHLLIIGSIDGTISKSQIFVLDLQSQKLAAKITEPEYNNYSPIPFLAVCPITRILFVRRGWYINAYQVQHNGELKLLHHFPRSNEIKYLKMKGTKLIVASTDRYQKIEQTFDFSKAESLLDLANEFVASPVPGPITAFRRFEGLGESEKNCIYESMDEVLKETNPNYHSFWQSGELAFHNKLDIKVTDKQRKLAVEKAHFKLLERKKAQKKITAVEPISFAKTEHSTEIKETEVLAYLQRLGIHDQMACSTFLQVHLSDLAKCGLINKQDLNLLGIFPSSLEIIDRTLLKIMNLNELAKEKDLTPEDCHSKIELFTNELSKFIGIIRFQRGKLEEACNAWIMDANLDRANIMQGDLTKLAQLEQNLETLLFQLKLETSLAVFHPEAERTVQEFLLNVFPEKLKELQACVDDMDTLVQTLHLQALDVYLKQYGLHAFWKKVKDLSPNMTLAALQDMEGFSSLPNMRNFS
jgi:hypothetical protein